MWPFKKKATVEHTAKVQAYIEREKQAAQVASVDGRHYTEWVDTVKELKRNGRLVEAEHLLLACVDAVERESNVNGYPISPWYYEQLAILYRQQKRFADEVGILERYTLHPLSHSEKLTDRLIKASELWSKAQGTLV